LEVLSPASALRRTRTLTTTHPPSHSHFDHTGNPDTFPKSTALVVGAGTQAAVRPGWPTNPDAMIPESDFEDREVVEVAFDAGVVGGMPAHDYFGDGSFYLLDAPGVRVS
jgi:hypothetical protein